MSEKSIELKEYKRSDGEKYYPVASFLNQYIWLDVHW